MNCSIEPIYRDLIDDVDIIQADDQFLNLDGVWTNAISVGEIYYIGVYFKHRRLDVRKINITEILYGKYK